MQYHNVNVVRNYVGDSNLIWQQWATINQVSVYHCGFFLLWISWITLCLPVDFLAENMNKKTFLLLWLDKDQRKSEIHSKIKFWSKDFFSKCDQVRRFLWNWSHLLEKSLMKNFIFCAGLRQYIKGLFRTLSKIFRDRCLIGSQMRL